MPGPIRKAILERDSIEGQRLPGSPQRLLGKIEMREGDYRRKTRALTSLKGFANGSDSALHGAPLRW